jgi:hypothetical protein
MNQRGRSLVVTSSHKSNGVARYGAMALVVLCEIIVPGSVRGQTGFHLTPSFSTTEVYDSNVFFAASNRLADFVTRLTPAIESQYQSPLLTFDGRYALDADRFADHPDLTTIDDRQNAGVDLRYRPTPRLALAADATFTRTHAPGELNAVSGLELTRTLAEHLSVHPSLTRQLDRTTGATVEYSFTEDSLPGLAGGVKLTTHAASIRVERGLSARGAVTAHYDIQRFEFGPTTVTTSQVLAVGWTHELTRQTSLAIGGGPRLTDGGVAPDISASIHTRARVVDLSLGYARTQTTLIGLAGTADAQSVTAAAQWEPWRLLQIRVEPGVFQATHLGLQSRSYRVGFKASRPITKGLSIVAAYDEILQHGNVYPTIGFDSISRNIASVSFAYTGRGGRPVDTGQGGPPAGTGPGAPPAGSGPGGKPVGTSPGGGH